MKILSNGSKWAGEEPDTVEELVRVLGVETLDPTFEKYGNFVDYENGFYLFGNFMKLSHVFRIRGELKELWPIIEAITENQNTEKYRKYRI